MSVMRESQLEVVARASVINLLCFETPQVC